MNAKWITGPYDHLQNQSQLIKKGFEEAGITEVLAQQLEPVDPYTDLD